MANFITDDTELASPKIDKSPVPPGQANKYLSSANWNEHRQALIDIRDHIKPAVPVNLRAVGCVPRDASKGADNVGIINELITQARSANRPLVMLIDDEMYIDKASTNASILIDDCHDGVAFIGSGRGKLIQQGVGTTNDWSGIVVNESSNVYMHGFTMEQGEIDRPSDGQHDHLIYIQDLGGSGLTRGIWLSDLTLGKCLGDCVTMIGDTTPINDIMISGLAINAEGFVQKAWAPNTSYALGAQVRNGGHAYICKTAGVSASSVGPSGSGASITDGTVVWSGAPGDITYRFAARSGISFQRGYQNVRVVNFNIRGVQNTGIDMESTGSGSLGWASFANGRIDNNLLNTGFAMSFSGSTSMSDPSRYSSIENVELYNGGLQIAETLHARIRGVRIVTDTEYNNDPSAPLCYVLRNNDGLDVDGLGLHRIGSAGDGECLSVVGANGGGKIRMRNVTLEQGTLGYPINVQDCPGLEIQGRVIYSGPSPSSYSAAVVSSIADDCNDINLDLDVECTSGVLLSAARFNSRNGFDMKSIRARLRSVVADSITVLASFSKESGTAYDANPIMIGCDQNGAELFESVDEGDNPINGIYPLIGGNKRDVCTLIGGVAPTGNVRAKQGSTYIHRNGDATTPYFKKEGISFGGWAEVTIGSPEIASLIMPSGASEWAAHIADNSLTSAAPTREFDCQVASGNLTAITGTLALIANGSVTYEETIPGYDDVAVGIPDGGSNTGFQTTDASLGNPATTSQMLVVIGVLDSVPASNRGFMDLSESNQVRLVKVSSDVRLRSLLVGDDGSPATLLTPGAVKVWFAQVNETANTGVCGNEDILDQRSYMSASSSAKRIALGGFDAASPPFKAMRIYHWDGAAAEMSLAEIREMLESFGAAVGWTP